jgi:hypothetical protein
MFTRKTFLIFAAALTVVSTANANLILTLNGSDTSDFPLIIWNVGDLLVSVAGSTQIEPNDVSVSAVGGVLEPVPDANHQYYFEFNSESSEGTVSLVTNVDMVIDGNSIPAGTTIYELSLFYNRQYNILAAAGIGLEDLLPPDQGAGAQESGMMEELLSPAETPTLAVAESTVIEEENASQTFNEPLPLLVSCPNDTVRPYRLEEFTHSPINTTQAEGNFGTLGFATLGGTGYVELQEITSSQFLDPNVTYYVPYPPLLIHGISGEEIDVVIPSDTTIVFAEVWDYGIVVYDGASVSFGEPAPVPNEPNTIYESNDVNNPVPPVWVIGESGSPFFNNFCGIFVDRTAGIRCKLDNIYLSGFYYGMSVDQQLDQPISNIHIFGCYNGIISFGPNRIMNSSVSYYGIWSSQWPYDGYAYEFMPQSADESVFFEGADFEIYNCLADDGDYAFTANGLNEPYEEPNLYARDCAATNSYTGFNCVNGLLGISVICPGLYNNFQDKNFSELPFTDPVYETNDPFVTDPNDYRIFLNPNSQFVNHGSGLTPFLGWTTNINGTPDEGIGDIWPHYQTKRVDKWLTADLNSDNSVDMNDLAEFVGQWLNTTPVSGDFNNDHKVNFLDYSVLANQWLTNEMSIELIDPNTSQIVEPNNVQGYVGIRLKNIPVSAEIVTVYLDNVQIGGWLLGLSDRERLISLESDSFSNGWHTIRLVSADIYGNVINHKPVNVHFNNLLYKVSGNDYFHPEDDYKFSGFYDGSSTLEAKVTNLDGQVIWSNTYNGPHVNIVIPGATFGNEQFCELSIAETESGMMAGAGMPGAPAGPSVTEKDLTKEFRQADCPAGIKMVIVLPNEDIFEARKDAIFACAKACNRRNVSWVSLCNYDVTEDNLRFLYGKPSVKYIYWCGHANNNVKGVYRTHTECWRKGAWWDIFSKWNKIKVFSYTRQAVPDAEPLPDGWDTRGFDLWSLGMHNSWNKKIVFVDGCLSATYPGDMAYAYGMFSLQGQGSKDQIYIGWRMVVQEKKVLDIFAGDTTKGVKLFWERMGRNDENSVRQALQYTCDHPISGPMLITMWGLNLETDFGDVGGDDGIFVWGNGFVNLNQIRLEP